MSDGVIRALGISSTINCSELCLQSNPYTWYSSHHLCPVGKSTYVTTDLAVDGSAMFGTHTACCNLLYLLYPISYISISPDLGQPGPVPVDNQKAPQTLDAQESLASALCQALIDDCLP